jgi:hypothetical protein
MTGPRRHHANPIAYSNAAAGPSGSGQRASPLAGADALAADGLIALELGAAITRLRALLGHERRRDPLTRQV